MFCRRQRPILQCRVLRSIICYLSIQSAIFVCGVLGGLGGLVLSAGSTLSRALEIRPVASAVCTLWRVYGVAILCSQSFQARRTSCSTSSHGCCGRSDSTNCHSGSEYILRSTPDFRCFSSSTCSVYSSVSNSCKGMDVMHTITDRQEKEKGINE